MDSKDCVRALGTLFNFWNTYVNNILPKSIGKYLTNGRWSISSDMTALPMHLMTYQIKLF